MKKGLSAIAIVVIILGVILVALIVWWQYRMYNQRKNIEKIENQIMNGTYPGLSQ